MGLFCQNTFHRAFVYFINIIKFSICVLVVFSCHFPWLLHRSLSVFGGNTHCARLRPQAEWPICIDPTLALSPSPISQPQPRLQIRILCIQKCFVDYCLRCEQRDAISRATLTATWTWTDSKKKEKNIYKNPSDWNQSRSSELESELSRCITQWPSVSTGPQAGLGPNGNEMNCGQESAPNRTTKEKFSHEVWLGHLKKFKFCYANYNNKYYK